MTLWVAKITPFGMPIEMTHTARTLEELAAKVGVCRTTLWKIYTNRGKSLYKMRVFRQEENDSANSNIEQ